MCAIFGSTDRNMFDVLYDANKHRGEFASSIVFINHDNSFEIKQREGHINLDATPTSSRHKIFLGHCQAPTSAQRKYDTATSHPFKYGKWFVAHNGVLTNHKELNERFAPFNKNPVDTSTIAAMISTFKNENPEIEDEVILQKVFSLLEGTFAIWAFCVSNPAKIYLARQGSTLFANENSFSSIQGKGWKELDEGRIYIFENNKIRESLDFQATSPFLVL